MIELTESTAFAALTPPAADDAGVYYILSEPAHARRLNRFPDLVVYDPATGTRRTAPAPTPVPLDIGMTH